MFESSLGRHQHHRGRLLEGRLGSHLGNAGSNPVLDSKICQPNRNLTVILSRFPRLTAWLRPFVDIMCVWPNG